MVRQIVSVVKFILGILLLPAVAAVSVTFYRALSFDNSFQPAFLWGVWSYVLCHLFILTPKAFFHFWQKVFGDLFRFSAVLAAILPLVIPILATLVLLVYYILNSFLDVRGIEQPVIFAVGLTLAMHVILAAQALYEEEASAFKPHYVFTMSLSYLLNILFVVLLLDLIFEKISIVEFCKTLGPALEKAYLLFYHKFLPSKG